MIPKQEIHDRIAKNLQELLEFAQPSNMNEALDVIALHIEAGGVYLAAAASRKQSADALRTIAEYINEVELPVVVFGAANVASNATKH